jgi:hypothetical protein
MIPTPEYADDFYFLSFSFSFVIALLNSVVSR